MVDNVIITRPAKAQDRVPAASQPSCDNHIQNLERFNREEELRRATYTDSVVVADDVASAQSEAALLIGAATDFANNFNQSNFMNVFDGFTNIVWNLVDTVNSVVGFATSIKNLLNANTSQAKRKIELGIAAVGFAAGLALGASTIAGMILSSSVLLAATITPALFCLASAIDTLQSAFRCIRAALKTNRRYLAKDRENTYKKLKHSLAAENLPEDRIALIHDIEHRLTEPSTTLNGKVLRLYRVALQCELFNAKNDDQQAKIAKDVLIETQRNKAKNQGFRFVMSLALTIGFGLCCIPALLPISALVVAAATALTAVVTLGKWAHASYHDYLAQKAKAALNPEGVKNVEDQVKSTYGKHWAALSHQQQQGLLNKAYIDKAQADSKTFKAHPGRRIFNWLAHVMKSVFIRSEEKQPISRWQRFKNGLKRIAKFFACVIMAPLTLLVAAGIAIKHKIKQQKTRSKEDDVSVSQEVCHRPENNYDRLKKMGPQAPNNTFKPEADTQSAVEIFKKTEADYTQAQAKAHTNEAGGVKLERTETSGGANRTPSANRKMIIHGNTHSLFGHHTTGGGAQAHSAKKQQTNKPLVEAVAP
ncbi:MAG: hypothetical protein COV52_02910 [Gammaproteobacteria bacterium CG11_big_fil_rev_8_21_14_0_20_46_22]|nr:MAG: hypothetical protein COW05_02150 [Gammaproteobacteria bacterium CG12_big_fil_rev_8_21_14_0_65_46_12]PIR11725.1 MAG: hypothetical protein COV52_02910 [Gammaproteobacteria bacterium CG11_big_fil_rev_8_21_14_0_20_46_22]